MHNTHTNCLHCYNIFWGCLVYTLPDNCSVLWGEKMLFWKKQMPLGAPALSHGKDATSCTQRRTYCSRPCYRLCYRPLQIDRILIELHAYNFNNLNFETEYALPTHPMCNCKISRIGFHKTALLDNEYASIQIAWADDGVGGHSSNHSSFS